MEEYKNELLEKLVNRYNSLHQKSFGSMSPEYREYLRVRATEVRSLIEDLFGKDSVVVTSKSLSYMIARKD